MSTKVHTVTRPATVLTAVIALVASLVVTGIVAGSPAGASPAGQGRLRICATTAHARWVKFGVSRVAYHRTVWLRTAAAGRPMCRTLQVKRAAYKVHQVTKGKVTAIKVSPAARVTSQSRSARSARVLVTSHGTRVLFRNARMIKTKPTGSTGTGYVEVCKRAGDSSVHGSVTVTVAGGGVSYSQTVPVGQCTGALPVPAGTATVSEAASFPYYLAAVRTLPAANLLSVNLANSQAKVRVVASPDGSKETLVNLYNKTHTGFFKVCKILGSNAQSVIDSGNNTFYFDAMYQRAGGSWTNYGTLAVTVPTLNQAACTISNPLPLDSVVKVTEESAPNTMLAGITIQPASANLGSSGSTAYFRLGTSQDSVVSATFTNTATGTIEVCKTVIDNGYDGLPFSFSVNGGPQFTVLSGHCSGPMTVPAGTATVQEFPRQDFQLVNWTATGPDGSSRLLTGNQANPITVSVPFGGVGNETLVTAYNRVNTAQFKVCKMIDSTVPVGKTYTFTATTYSGGQTSTSTVSLTPTGAGPSGEDCSSLSGSYPVVLPDGSRTTTTVTEGASPFGLTQNGEEIVEPTAATYQGNGKQGATRVFQLGDTGAQDGTYYTSATLGQGVNVFTFTNSLVLDP